MASDEKEKKADVEINRNFCKLCGICVTFCPVKNLSIRNQKLNEHGKCIACCTCEQRCPDFAITIKLLNGQEANTR